MLAEMSDTIAELDLRIFVTGATGFIGSAFAAEAVLRGHEVTALVRNPGAWRLAGLNDQVKLIPGDVADAELCRKAILENRPNAIAHLAWTGVSGKARDSANQADNVGWSAKLMAAAIEAEVPLFVGVGSQAEYGPRSGIIAPSDPTHPTTLYGEAKLATSRILARLSQRSATRLAWVRIFSTYGPGDQPYWMIPSLISSLLAGKRPALTAGEQLWDFLHVADAARALLDVAEGGASAGIYNLGSGQAPTLGQTMRQLRDLVDPNLELGIGEVDYRPDQVMHLQADVTRLTEEFGWRPQIPLDRGLRETVDWYRQNRWIFS